MRRPQPCLTRKAASRCGLPIALVKPATSAMPPSFIACWRKASRAMPRFMSHWETALTGAGEFDQAADAYRTAIATDRSNINARLGLGRVAMQLRQADLAEIQFAAVVDQVPNDTRGRVGLGVALDTLGRHA